MRWELELQRKWTGNAYIPKANCVEEAKGKKFIWQEVDKLFNVCGAKFATQCAFRKHQSQEHRAMTHPTKWLPTGATVCAVCATDHHDYARLVKHLMACETCRLPWFSKAQQLSDEGEQEAIRTIRKIQADSRKAALPQ